MHEVAVLPTRQARVAASNVRFSSDCVGWAKRECERLSNIMAVSCPRSEGTVPECREPRPSQPQRAQLLKPPQLRGNEARDG
eukprot:3312954-Prymnesium_polylepis.2